MKTNNKERATRAKLFWLGGVQLVLAAFLSVTLPAVGYAQMRAGDADRPNPSQRGSSSSGSYSSPSSPGYSMPPAAAQALERARQYQNMGEAVNRGLDQFRESYERDRQREEERERQREEREERARQREEERQERAERARERENAQRWEDDRRSYQPAPARQYEAPAYQPQLPAYQPPPPPPPPPTPEQQANEVFGAAMRYRDDADSENSSASISDRLRDYGNAFQGGAQSMWRGLIAARDTAKPYVQEAWDRLGINTATEGFRELRGEGGNLSGGAVEAGVETVREAANSAWRNLMTRVTGEVGLPDDLSPEQRAEAQAGLQYNRDVGTLIEAPSAARPSNIEFFNNHVGAPIDRESFGRPVEGESR